MPETLYGKQCRAAPNCAMAVALARLFYMMQGINPMTDSTKPRTLKDQLESETADTERSAAVDSERYHGGDWWQLTDAEESVFVIDREREAPSHPAPHDAAPAEEAKPEPPIDQACMDRLGAAGIEFEAVTLPPAAKPGCTIEMPVRLKAVKLAPRWRTSIRLPDEPMGAVRTGLREKLNQSPSCRNGNWKIASRDRRPPA
jgi:hypothetical protein